MSVMTQNMALLVSPAPYLGTDRNGARAEIISRILGLSPDVVGLCEVFDDDDREKIRVALRMQYPHTREGPDEADLESDGGLLLLSKHPIESSHDTIFRECDGVDCFANKGVIHVRVHPLLRHQLISSTHTCRTLQPAKGYPRFTGSLPR